MVSLGEDSSRSGGFFFDQSDTSVCNQDSEDLIDHNTLGIEDDPGFRKIKTPPVICVVLLITVLLGVSVFLVPVLCYEASGDNRCRISPYSALLYTHASVWFLIMLADRYLRHQHYISRTMGYLEFYRTTRNIRRVPFMVFSGGNAVLIVFMTVLQDYCFPDVHHHCRDLPLSPSNFLQGSVVVECAIIIPAFVVYLVRTVRFNQKRACPDVHQDDMLSTYLQSHTHAGDVGFRDEDFMDDVLEKQADLIRYLKQHNANLGKRIVKLTSQLQNGAHKPS